MKEKIHPKYIDCTVVCGCGETFKTRSTRERIAVEICSKCHPFYTGKQKFVDTAGMVEKFQRKYDKVRDVVAEKRKKEDDEKKAKLAEQARKIDEDRKKKDEDRKKKQAEREAWVARQQSVAAAKAAQAEQQATAEEARSGDAAPPAEGEKPQA